MRTIACFAAALLVAVTRPAQGADHYVDPENGSDQADGSSAHPWRSLQKVIDEKVETRGWKELPYDRPGNSLIPVNAGAPVKPGDTLWLRSGDYGPLTIEGAYNEGTVTIAAGPGQTPKLTRVLVRASQNWTLRGLSVSPSHGSSSHSSPIVTVEDHGWQGPASDVVIDGFEIFSVPDESVWTTPEDWDTKAADAVIAASARVMVRNCRIRNVAYGIAMGGRGSRVEHNTVDGFCGDGLRGLGDDEVFEYNLVKNARQVNADHVDGFQSWSVGPGGVGTGVVKNVTLRGNTFVNGDDPRLPFLAQMQGIGCFDGIFDGWVVENNVVLTDHWHGISFYGATNLRIINNSVFDLNQAEPGPPWILVHDHKDGRSSWGVRVSNNLVATPVSAGGPGIEVDHNLVVEDPAAFFVDFVHRDLRLRDGSPAIGQGAATGAPRLDAACIPRPQGAAVDVGAYEYAAGDVAPDCSLGGAVVEPWAPAPLPGSGCGTSGGAAGLGLLVLAGLGWRRFRRGAG